MGSGEAAQKRGLEGVLVQWKTCWNAVDQQGLIALHHPESKLRRAYESKPEARSEITKEFVTMLDECGNITDYEIRKYIGRKKRFVVRVTYKKKSCVPGTFAVRRGDDGSWLVLDFNIDGQGEPELSE